MRIGAIGVGAHACNAILPNIPVAGMTLAATCARQRSATAAAGWKRRASDIRDRR